MSKYDPFPEDITEDELMAKLDDPDSGVRLMVLLNRRSNLHMWLKALDDREFFIFDIAATQIRRHVRMLSANITDVPWEFCWLRRDGRLIFRKGEDHVFLTPDELRQAIADGFVEQPTAAGEDTLFYVDLPGEKANP